ncbi:MAG TPA: hypothetical protein VF615_19655 [Longimicrobiaceae bacterium]|jgi:hypothetical protein
MSRSFIHLRRILFGTSCAVVFGFGANQGLAAPMSSKRSFCTMEERAACVEWCASQHGEGFSNAKCVMTTAVTYYCICELM